jgi:hypothetical protein
MRTRYAFALLTAVAGIPIALHAATLEPIHKHCTIGPGDKAGTFSLQMDDADCGGRKQCGMNRSDEPFSRFNGFTEADLAHDGASETAKLIAEAGTFVCAGTVRNGELSGDSTFTPDGSFVARMGQMGFTGYDSDKLLAYAFLDIQSGYARSLQEANIKGIDIDNLIALHIFDVTPAYVHDITALGYPQPDADQLISLKCQGVNAEEVRAIRALGYKPSLDELVQIRIFKITPEFIHRMEARGLMDLTIAKLVQIRIFNLAE